jgi:hypothetical protein
MRRRPSARLLVLNPIGSVLLFRFPDDLATTTETIWPETLTQMLQAALSE